MTNADNQTTDPRLLPIARRLCSQADDEWRLGKKLWTANARELLAIADAADPVSKLKELERAERSH